jgi:hypothetical protein
MRLSMRGTLRMSRYEESLDAIGREMRERRESYERIVLNSPDFQNGLGYLHGIASDLLLAHGRRYQDAQMAEPIIKAVR